MPICPVCNQGFIAKPHNKKYCSDTCRIAEYAAKGLYGAPKRHEVACVFCGEIFEASRPNAKYCSDGCRIRAWRKRLEEGNASSEQKMRFAILARDGFRCRYCGRSPSDGIKLTVDHIVARHNGGTNEPSNLITCCLDCNLGKGTLLLLGKKHEVPSFLTIESIQRLPPS